MARRGIFFGPTEGTRLPVKNGVVAHYQDGRILKGITHDFSPTRPTFRLRSSDDPGGTAGTLIRSGELKALFFVRNLEGDPLRTDLRGFIAGPTETVHGKKIAVRFSDGELFCGYTLGYTPQRGGFFMFPADAGSNNLRVFVVTAAAPEVCEGTAADELVQRVLNAKAA